MDNLITTNQIDGEGKGIKHSIRKKNDDAVISTRNLGTEKNKEKLFKKLGLKKAKSIEEQQEETKKVESKKIFGRKRSK